MSIYGLKKVKHDRSGEINIMAEIYKECDPFFETEEEHEEYSIFDQHKFDRMSLEDLYPKDTPAGDYLDMSNGNCLEEYDIINNIHLDKELIIGDTFLTGILEHLKGEHDTLVNKALTLKPFMTHKIGKSFLDEPLAHGCDNTLSSICAHASAINHLIVGNILNNLADRLFGSFVLTLDMKGCPSWMNTDYYLTMLVHLLRTRSFNAYKVKDSNTGKFVIFVCTTNKSNSFPEEIALMKTYLRGLLKGDILNPDGRKFKNYVINVKDIYMMADSVTFSVKKEAISTKLNFIDKNTSEANQSLEPLRDTDCRRFSEFGGHLDKVCNVWLNLMRQLGTVRDNGVKFESALEILRVLGRKEVGNNVIELFTDYYAGLRDYTYWATIEGQDLIEDINRQRMKFVNNMIERYKAYYYGYLNLRTNLEEEEAKIMARMMEAMG